MVRLRTGVTCKIILLSRPLPVHLFSFLVLIWFSSCVVCSKYFFTADSQTSSKPLIVAAGFDGTGLSALERALALLGKTNTAFPAFGTDGECDPARPEDNSGRQCAHRSLIDAVTQFGFQSTEFPPSIWSNTDAVLGHPVPMFVWDFLEAFPNAKVILTVRQADELWDALRQLASYSWSSKLSDRSYRFPFKMLLFGMQRDLRIDQRHFLRNYLQHNAKVIHGVPRRQLLVWDMYKQPGWEPLCTFLDIPVPSVAFPVPIINEY